MAINWRLWLNCCKTELIEKSPKCFYIIYSTLLSCWMYNYVRSLVWVLMHCLVYLLGDVPINIRITELYEHSSEVWNTMKSNHLWILYLWKLRVILMSLCMIYSFIWEKCCLSQVLWNVMLKMWKMESRHQSWKNQISSVSKKMY